MKERLPPLPEQWPRILALIPARGGSKGLPGKNLADLGGIPVVAWSIRSALASRLVDEVVVSTDDDAIAEAARKFGAATPFTRPPELSGDTALIGDVTSHAVNELTRQGRRPGIVAVLYPTSPFRPAGMVDLLLSKILEGRSEAATYVRLQDETAWLVESEDQMQTICAPPGQRLLSGTGHCEARSLCGTGEGRYVHIMDNPLHIVDIDSADDLRLARAILERGLFSTGEKSCKR